MLLRGRVVVRALDLPRRLHGPRVCADLRAVVPDAEPEVHAEHQDALHEQDLQLVDADRRGLGFREHGVTGLSAHEVLAVQLGQVVAHEVPHVWPVDAVREAELLQAAIVRPDLPPLLEDGHLVPAEGQLDRQPHTHRPAAHDEDAQWDDVRVLARHPKVQVLALAVGGAAALQLVEALPHPRPLPVAAVADDGLELLVREHRVRLVVRRAAHCLDNDLLHLLVVELLPDSEEVLAILHRRLRL
mmetsp:Transcript_31320/g.91341  ORF Transcript_31320/g.91341 Transcript_31320/m.91341 type:complete len:244 (+) Transcript_31320:1693-2424(+)